MAKYTFKYGNGTREFEYPEEDVIKHPFLYRP